MADNLRVRVGKFSTGTVRRADGDGVPRNFVADVARPGQPMLFRDFAGAARTAGFILDTQSHLRAQVRPLNGATGNLARYGVSVGRAEVL